jgi:hypothetical protein
MKIKHPRKIVKVMRDFINVAHGLTYGENNCNVDCGLRKLSEVNFCSCFDPVAPNTFWIGYNFGTLEDKQTRETYKNFIERFPSGRGFATITLILLHEIGHAYHPRSSFENYDKEKAMEEIYEIANTQIERQKLYMDLPDEYAATEWAIDWLKDPEHRKIAKRFEKQFFECY